MKVAPLWNTLTVSTACLMRSGWPPMVSGCMTSPSTKSMTSAPSGSSWYATAGPTPHLAAWIMQSRSTLRSMNMSVPMPGTRMTYFLPPFSKPPSTHTM